MWRAPRCAGRFNRTSRRGQALLQAAPSCGAALCRPRLIAPTCATQWISVTGEDLAWLSFVLTVYAGITMVSNVPFYSFKDIDLKKSVPFIFVIGVVMVFVLVSSDPPSVLFALFLLYGVSGWLLWLWRWRRGEVHFRRRPPWGGDEAFDGDDDDEGEGVRDDADELRER